MKRVVPTGARTPSALSISLVTLGCAQLTGREGRRWTWRHQIIVYLKLFSISLDFESCFSCQILSINIYFLPGSALGCKQKVKISRMNLFLHFLPPPQRADPEPGGCAAQPSCGCGDGGPLNSAFPSLFLQSQKQLRPSNPTTSFSSLVQLLPREVTDSWL